MLSVRGSGNRSYDNIRLIGTSLSTTSNPIWGRCSLPLFVDVAAVVLVGCDGLGGGKITKSEVVLLDAAVFLVDALLGPAVGPDFPCLIPSLTAGVWWGLLFLLPPAIVVVVIISLVVVDSLRANIIISS